MKVAQVVTDFATKARGHVSKSTRFGQRGPVADLIQLAVLATQAVEEMWLDPKFRPRIDSAKRWFDVMPSTFRHRRAANFQVVAHEHIGDKVRNEMNSTPVAFIVTASGERRRGRPFAKDALSVALQRFELWVVFGGGIEPTAIFRPEIVDERKRGGFTVETSPVVLSGRVIEKELRKHHSVDAGLRDRFSAEQKLIHRRLIDRPDSDYKSWAKEFERFVKVFAPYEVNSPLGFFHRQSRSKLAARQRAQLRRKDGRYDKDTEKALWTAFRQVVEARLRRLLR